jgi:hypothetical protein
VLDEARKVVEQAIQKIEGGQLRAGRKIRESLYVERASIYGFLAVGHALSGEGPEIVWADYLAARAATRRAMGIASSYYPIDVSLWTSRDILRKSGTDFSESQRAELAADIYSALDRVYPEDLSPDQLQRFNVSRANAAGALRDVRLEESALLALGEQNPPVAVFLRARKLVEKMLESRVPSPQSDLIEQARLALGYLNKEAAIIASDTRCQRLRLDLAWFTETGQRLLRGERRKIPFSREARSSILQIVRDLHSASGAGGETTTRYVEAVLLWMLGSTRDAIEIWRDIARETEYEDRRRVVRRLIITDAAGVGVLYRGRLVEGRTQGHWSVDVEGIGGRVELLERDFRESHLRPGGEIREFRIAFNYLGPIADPPMKHGGGR